MIELSPNVLYTRTELDALLREHGGISLDGFLDGLDVKPRFRHCIMGAELLRAMDRACCDEAPARHPAPIVPVIHTGKPGRPRKCPEGLEPLALDDILTKDGGA